MNPAPPHTRSTPARPDLGAAEAFFQVMVDADDHRTGVIGLTLHGELDATEAEELDRAAHLLIEGQPPGPWGRPAYLDLTGLTFLDTAGLDCLLRARDVLRSGGRRVVAVGAQGRVGWFLEIAVKLGWLSSDALPLGQVPSQAETGSMKGTHMDDRQLDVTTDMPADEARETALQEAGLEESLAGLSGLLSGSVALETTLVRVAELAVAAIPGAEGAGLTLLENDRPQTVVATADFVRDVDDIQYRLNEGPCVSAVAEARTVTSGNLGGEPQWPHFGPRVGRLGVHSALSLPLLLPGRVVGAMNVYARGREAFDAHAIALGEAFAGPAAVSVANAQLLAQAERLVGQLQDALISRAEIDQAVGVMMSRSGLTATDAFARLRVLSQSRGVKVSVVAHDLLAQARATAIARHTDRAERDSAGDKPAPTGGD